MNSPGLGAAPVQSIWKKNAEDPRARDVHIQVSLRAAKGICPFPGERWVLRTSHIKHRSLMHQDILLLPNQGQNGKKPARVLM